MGVKGSRFGNEGLRVQGLGVKGSRFWSQGFRVQGWGVLIYKYIIRERLYIYIKGYPSLRGPPMREHSPKDTGKAE